MSGTTTHYFSHDADARHDPKIVCMMNIFGVEGYGIYWCIVEILREEDNFKYKINNKYWAEGLAGECKTTPDIIRKFIDTCVEIELFQRDDKYFWSDSLRKRMGKMTEIIENNRKAAKIRWNKYSKGKKESDKDNEIIIEEEEKEPEIKQIKTKYVPGKILFSLKRGKFVGIKEEDYIRWEKEYPFLDVRGIISNMEDYWIDHKDKAREKRDTWRTVISNRLYYQAKHFEGDKSQDWSNHKEEQEIKEQAEYEKRETRKIIEANKTDSTGVDPNISSIIKETISNLKGGNYMRIMEQEYKEGN